MAATLELCKAEISDWNEKRFEENGFKAVIVKTEYKKNKFTFGVQFWSDFLINAGKSRNSDGTLAKLIEVL